MKKAKQITWCDDSQKVKRSNRIPVFKEIQLGTVFNFIDGRLSESSTWFPYVKISETQALLLCATGKREKKFITHDIMDYLVSTEVKMDSTQWEVGGE